MCLIFIVIACFLTVSLAIKNTPDSLILSYEDANEILATINFNRTNMMQKYDPNNSENFEDMKEIFELGKTYAIKGRSGSGKTTLLSLLSGLEKCGSGHIYYDGQDLNNLNLDKYRNSYIGIIFQSYNLLPPHLTASENIILSMDISHLKIHDKKSKAIELMESVGLSKDYVDRKILKLSGGEQQRIPIARSLSYNPKIILADEPTGNLDKETENEILNIFKRLAKEENKCIIIVTHSENVCAKVDEIYELKKENKTLNKSSLKKKSA